MKTLRLVLITAALGVVYALPLFTLPGFGAAYLKIANVTGESLIKGESLGEDQEDATGGTVNKHKDEIDILAWSWGSTEPAASGTGSTSGSECIQDFSFTKFIDKSSPDLLLHCLNGENIPEATLAVTRPTAPGATTSFDYLTIRFIDVVVRAVANAGDSSSPDRPVESFAINYTKITYSYRQDNKGTTQPVEFSWNLNTNQEF